jgi:glycosyltransferase involved in cell wall biosynthesis
VRAAQWLNYKCADVVLATNETNRQAALTNGGKDPNRVFMVRTAPKIPNTTLPADTSLKRGRKFLVGYVGVMGSADGVHLLLEAAATVVHELGRRDIQFLLMGDGPEFDPLRRSMAATRRRLPPGAIGNLASSS